MRILLCAFLIAALAFAAAAADATGKWSGTFTQENGDGGGAILNLKQSGDTVTGTGGPEDGPQWPISEGKVAGNKVTFTVKSADENVTYKCDLTLSGDNLKGDVVVTAPDGSTQKATLDMHRVK